VRHEVDEEFAWHIEMRTAALVAWSWPTVFA
jgi:hypothetical protein